MPTDLPLRCRCGALRGVARNVSAGRGNRLVCYCQDCQSFAHFLGDAEHILDAHGGTEIFQTSPSRITITSGAEQLACMRLTPKGLLRWYADCCRTPLGNTAASPQMPFVGLVHSCMDPGSLGRSRDEVLGPVRARVNARFAKGDRARLAMILRVVPLLALARLRGEHSPSPFFDPASGEPSREPRVLDEAQLRAVEAARDAR